MPFESPIEFDPTLFDPQDIRERYLDFGSMGQNPVGS